MRASGTGTGCGWENGESSSSLQEKCPVPPKTMPNGRGFGAKRAFLMASAQAHLWQGLQSPRPGFGRFTQICREAHRRGKPEILRCALDGLVPIRTASGEDMRVLLRLLDGLSSALTLAGQEMAVRPAGRGNAGDDARAVAGSKTSGSAVPAALWRGAVNIHAFGTAATSEPLTTSQVISSNFISARLAAALQEEAAPAVDPALSN
jgi:hypothetical protein